MLDAPRGAVGADLLALLKAHRDDLVAVLTGAAPAPAAQATPTPAPTPEFEALLAEVGAAVRQALTAQRLSAPRRDDLRRAAQNLLEDCRAMWREGKMDTAVFLARDYTRRIPAYLATEQKG